MKTPQVKGMAPHRRSREDAVQVPRPEGHACHVQGTGRRLWLQQGDRESKQVEPAAMAPSGAGFLSGTRP